MRSLASSGRAKTPKHKHRSLDRHRRPSNPDDVFQLLADSWSVDNRFSPRAGCSSLIGSSTRMPSRICGPHLTAALLAPSTTYRTAITALGLAIKTATELADMAEKKTRVFEPR